MKRTDRAGVFFVILVLTLFGVILNHRGVESSALNAGASTASLKKKGKVDSLKDTAYHAVNIREYHPAPAWETLFHNEGVSDIQFLSKDKILVATIQLQGAAGNPRSGSFIVYDVTSGEKIWERPRKQLLGKDSIDNVISTTPVIIDLNSSLEEYVFTAVDPETGEQLWEYKTKGPQAYALSPSHNSLLLSSRSGSNVVVTSLSLKNGQELWSVKLPEPSLEKAKAAEVKIQGSDVFIFGSQVNKLSMADGAHSWSAAFSADGVVPDNLIINPEGIYVANGTTLKILDLKDGRVLWEYTSSDAPILLISPYPGKVFTLIGEIAQESPAYKVLALDAASGKVFWSYPLKASLSSSFLYYADFLYFTTPSSLIALNANSGQLKSSTHLPDKMQATPLLPDILKAIGDRLLVVREKAGLAAFDLSSSELLFHQSPISCPGFLSSNARFYGLQGVMNMYLKSPENAEQVDKDFAEMRESMRKNFLVNAQRSTEASLMMDIYSLDLEPGTSTSSIMPQNLQESSLVSMARRHTEWAKRSGGDDLVTALRLESAALKVDAAMESMMRTISLCNQVVDLFFTLRAQRELSKIQANISRRQVELTGAIKYHALSLQNDYYLYPFRQWGRGVTIVNTGTGLRTDLVYSPQNIVHDSFRGIEYPVFAVCPEGKRLITYGISLNPNKYEGYVRENTTVPYQSIFCYDLKSLEFKKANNNSIDFTGAVAQGDIPKLNKALAEGVNVNSRGVTGNTGLIYA
ncbi:MAG: PQQ-binding-like beta-propeller repeat protein, partial [Candidatus Aminicenantes bacterium]